MGIKNIKKFWKFGQVNDKQHQIKKIVLKT